MRSFCERASHLIALSTFRAFEKTSAALARRLNNLKVPMNCQFVKVDANISWTAFTFKFWYAVVWLEPKWRTFYGTFSRYIPGSQQGRIWKRGKEPAWGFNAHAGEKGVVHCPDRSGRSATLLTFLFARGVLYRIWMWTAANRAAALWIDFQSGTKWRSASLWMLEFITKPLGFTSQHLTQCIVCPFTMLGKKVWLQEPSPCATLIHFC